MSDLRMSRSRLETNSMHDSDSATSSEIGDITEVDDYDFLEFLGDWSESIMFEKVADEIDYGESSSNRFKEESASFKKRRMEDNQSSMRLNSNTLLMMISAEEKPPLPSNPLFRKPLKSGMQNGDIILKGPDDSKLEAIPEKLYQAFSGGNLKLVSQIISSSFAQECIFQTMLMDTPLIGRQFVYKFFEAFTVSHPDIVIITKNPKVVQDPEGRCIKYKFFWTGTNVFPIEAKSYYFEKNGNLTKYLDVSKLNKKEISVMKALAVRVRASGTPYASVGRGVGRLGLNEKDEITSFRVNWRLLSIRDPTDDDSSTYKK